MTSDLGSIPGLTIFIWQDGARFDSVMNQYMSAGYPVGIDPVTSMALSRNGSYGLLSSGNVSLAATANILSAESR